VDAGRVTVRCTVDDVFTWSTLCLPASNTDTEATGEHHWR